MENNNPLMKTHLEIKIVDLMVEYEIEHYFINKTDTVIEAIFTFPIPMNAAFISMTANIAGEVLTSQIMPRNEAAHQYDAAINEGHSAAIVERVEPGLLCVMLGNLAVNEEGTIKIKFADNLSVFNNIARFSLPVVNLPRYGLKTLEPFSQFAHDFAITHPLSANIQVTGLLKDSIVACLSHHISYLPKFIQNTILRRQPLVNHYLLKKTWYKKANNVLRFSLDNAMLDRDFILEFKIKNPPPAQCYLIPQQDHYIGLIKVIAPPSKNEQNSICLGLIVDNSLSISLGASVAMNDNFYILSSLLHSDDYVQFFQFATKVLTVLYKPMKYANLVDLDIYDELSNKLSRFYHNPFSSFYGVKTNLVLAIETAVEQLQTIDHSNKIIILVSDGAIEPSEITKAKEVVENLNIRVFIITIGDSPGVDILKPLADATNGFIEQSTPCNLIYECVERAFSRARVLSPCQLTIDYPENSQLLSVDTFYPCDGTVGILQLPHAVEQLSISINDEQQQLPCHIETEHNQMLLTLYGQRLYQAVPDTQKEHIALQYNLLTLHTSAVLVKEREDRFDALPTIINVPQMYAEGTVVPSSISFEPVFMLGGSSKTRSQKKSKSKVNKDKLNEAESNKQNDIEVSTPKNIPKNHEEELEIMLKNFEEYKKSLPLIQQLRFYFNDCIWWLRTKIRRFLRLFRRY